MSSRPKASRAFSTIGAHLPPAAPAWSPPTTKTRQAEYGLIGSHLLVKGKTGRNTDNRVAQQMQFVGATCAYNEETKRLEADQKSGICMELYEAQERVQKTLDDGAKAGDDMAKERKNAAKRRNKERRKLGRNDSDSHDGVASGHAHEDSDNQKEENEINAFQDGKCFVSLYNETYIARDKMKQVANTSLNQMSNDDFKGKDNYEKQNARFYYSNCVRRMMNTHKKLMTHADVVKAVLDAAEHDDVKTAATKEEKDDAVHKIWCEGIVNSGGRIADGEVENCKRVGVENRKEQ